MIKRWLWENFMHLISHQAIDETALEPVWLGEKRVLFVHDHFFVRSNMAVLRG